MYSKQNTIENNKIDEFKQNHNLSSLQLISPKGGETLKGVHSIIWTEVSDSLGHSVSYQVFYSSDNGKIWNELISDIYTTSYEWNTSLVKNNDSYMVMVRASCIEGEFTSVNSGLFSIQNTNTPSSTMLAFILILGVISVVGMGILFWKFGDQLREELPNEWMIGLSLGSFTDEGFKIQWKSEPCPFDEDHLDSILAYSAVLFQHGDFGNIYGPFPQNIVITRKTRLEWHFMTYGFRISDESVEDPRIQRNREGVPSLVLLFYPKQIDAIITAHKSDILNIIRFEIKQASSISELIPDNLISIKNQIVKIIS
ncbi:MAG: hypothetical protein ACW964_15865 [Candidatus Hodarchaeales archaeon]